MEGWLAQNNLARFVVEIVEQLDTSAIEGAYRGGGSAPILISVSNCNRTSEDTTKV